MWFLGIDVGTTHIKVVGVTSEGVALDPLRVRTPVTVNSGESFHSGPMIWDTVRELVIRYARGPILHADAGLLAAVAIGTFGQEEAFAVDARGEPLSDSRVWWENWANRALDADTIRWFDSPEHYAVSGMRFRDNQTPERIAQFRRRDPAAFDRTRRWVDFGSYLGFKLTGAWAASSTQITHSQMFDLATLEPHLPSIQRLGIDASMFPPVLHPGTRLGAILPDSVPGVAMKDDAAVYIGGHDQVIAAFANAASGADVSVLDSIGTAEYVMVTGEAFRPDERLFSLCVDIERGWSRDQYVLGWGLPTGKILQQLADQYFEADFEHLLEAIDPDANEAARSALSIDDDTILFTVNDLRVMNEKLFTISGVKPADSNRDIVAACVSQLSARIRDTVELLAEVSQVPLSSVTLTGSLFQRAELVRHRQHHWRVPLVVSQLSEAVATGAAQLAHQSFARYAGVVNR